MALTVDSSDGRQSLKCKGAGLRTAMSSTFIHETLSIYRPEYIALQAAEWDGSASQGLFRLSLYPFVLPGFLEYLTTPTATLYVSQLAYVHSRLVIRDGQLPTGIKITEECYFAARNRGDLVITRFFLKCRRKILLDVGDIVVRMATESMHRSGNHLVARFGFDFHERSFFGHAVMAMPLEAGPQAGAEPARPTHG